jgi:MoaA/NifB/PqqE/SkfB family radical SAM enzyme
LTLDVCKSIFEKEYAKKALVVQLTGGEPTLNRELADIIRYLKGGSRIVSMVTNGLLLIDEKVSELHEAGLDMVNISVYENTVSRLKPLLPGIGSKIFTKLSFVLTSSALDNLPLIESVVELASEENIMGLSFMPVHPTGFAETNNNFIFYDDDIRYKKLQKYLLKKYPSVNIYFSTASQKVINDKKKVCKMPWYFAIIDSKGRRGICCHDTECEHGNVFENTLQELMNSEFVMHVREGLLPGVDPSDYCKGCYMLSDKAVSTI